MRSKKTKTNFKKVFSKSEYIWKSTIDYRKFPHRYRVGKGEQGVLICRPYKDEILPYWRFKNIAEAKKSANKIFRLFTKYLKENDFIGADMARKFLQMGYTRARRYGNYRGGRKYTNDDKTVTHPYGSGDQEKYLCAQIFYEKWLSARKNKKYMRMKSEWQNKYG